MATKLQSNKRISEPLQVSTLLLDDQNFRLNEKEAKKASQDDLLKLLERDFALNSIAESMIDNGYFPEEPLSAIKGPEKDKYTVVEGNRRLATLKFLTDPECRKISEQKSYWEDASKRLKFDLQKVPVILYENREQLTNFLGFRHVAGILKWDPLSKARFIHSLIVRRGADATFVEIARETGSSKPTIRDNYVTYRILIQARDYYSIDTSNFERNFSVLYRALHNPSITHYIGLNKNLSISKLKHPIPKSKVEQLTDIIGFIYGSGSLIPVISDSRQLTKLGEILGHKEALQNLKLFRNLEQAYLLTGGEVKRLVENLERAVFYMKESLRDAFQYKNDKEVKITFLKMKDVFLEIEKSFPGKKDKAAK